MTEYIDIDERVLVTDMRGREIETTVRHILETNSAAYKTADVQPVRHGRWVSVPHKRERICSWCEQDEPYKFADENANVFDFCPHCGTLMDGGDSI